MAEFGLGIHITQESILELQDCVLLLKWRTGMEMSQEEIEILQTVLDNFHSSTVTLIKRPWNS